ncbi:phage capsid protein [Micromonospora zingiberis]|uniref:Phage capsid protein n=1 Tax=Micromonospora zingiberis TaxID=2053011 RepID=A0A4R0GJZ4_9ACTN|nr:phage capsid protein [Micromonospora zingiberis]TCB97576.1 phage capsid protein [Micromonospora zingiberis]
MPVTLAEASNNAQEDFDATVIDEFRKESTILDTLTFDDAVNPAGGGATMTYGYRRLATQATAATRELNHEYQAQNVTTTKHNVELAVMGGAFTIDRVIARIGPAASGAVALNMAQKVKATRTRFADEVINGDTNVDAHGFDGLDKALVGTSTEFRANSVTNWSDLDTDASVKHKALDDLDEFLSLLDGTPTILLGNRRLLAKVRGIVRRTGMYVRDPIQGLIGANGRPITRESYGGITFADPGDKAGSNSPIIPVETRTVGVSTTNLTDLYAYRVGLDGFHGVTTVGSQLVATWLPDFSTPGAVKSGEVELGPVAVALKATKAAAVFRNIKVA